MVQPKSTAGVSKALKSTYNRHNTGLIAEQKVIKLYNLKGFKLVKHRFKTPFSEVDLIFCKDSEWQMLEVKSSQSFMYLSNRQKKALTMSYYYLMNKYSKKLRAHLVLVDNNKINIIPDFLAMS